ncbi:SusC/RagA family TonB-linked outer membrane protein [Winogradskyella alexanderae]|uniref:SusC/RagA family TonB-linked outer membrane protein n=1 Tax=Winogradskyella alexanderae TaxID=2877123 RepID=A0ABS7XU32_9FLAO|nr:SusC/RagA family TonB-linked outer membrane protein [Winogradskyella alexanderae]MCA0132516.1 SusC/RagA family TonB-linked outer membrane protein [Winogradskyella alexanderae]
MTQNLLRKILSSFFLVLGSIMYAQTVTGTVSDVTGTLPGVNVIVKGTTNGVQTDLDGTYTLNNVASDAVIVFSYLGYKTQEVAVNGRSVIDVTLEEDVAQLEAVVVVGYGNQVRKEITTAVTSVSEEEFNKGVINNASQLLQGKVAGLSVYNRGGNPNDSGVIRLRGLSTVGGNTEPLVVIDGVLGQSLSNVDPSDIKNITVLKDGSAAAIYGSRASSGVILVTTKSGRTNQPFSVDYNGQYGVSDAINPVEIMNRQQFLATGGTDLGSDTDWVDEVTRSAFSQVHNIAMSGGAENTNYRVAVNYRDTEGILINSGFEQLNIRGNFTGTLFNDKLRINFNSAFTQRDSDFGFNEALRYAIVYNPTAPVFGDDAPFAFNSEQFGGYFETLGLFDSFNPVSIAEQNRNAGATTTINYNADFRYSFTDDLSATLNVGQQVSRTDNNQYYPTTSFFRGGAVSPFRKGRADFYSNEARSKTLELFGTYNRTFNDFFRMKLDGGYSFQENDFNENYLQVGDFPPGVNFDFSNAIEVSQDLNEAGRVIANSGRNDDDRIIAFFLRGNFTFDDAIYLSASIRREGSSRFGADNQWGTFPSVAVGADLNNYLQLDNVSLLKARLGYGVTGAIPPGVGLSQTSFNVINGAGGFGSSSTGIGTRLANPDLKWEEKRELNFGIEFAMDRLSATVDIYNRDIVDFISNVQIDAASNNGFTNQFQNAGELNTKGFELTVNYDIVRNDKVNYNMGLVASTYETVLEKNAGGDRMIANLGAPGQNDTEVILVREGDEVGQIWGPVFTGEVDANGSPILADINGDGSVIADQGSALADNGDFTVLGQGFPDWEIGWTHQVQYGNWDLNAFFRGAFGHSLVNSFRVFYEPRIGSQSSYNYVNTELARDDIRTAQFSSYYVEKADFLRLDNLTIGYNFDLGDNTFLKSARVAITAQNLFTITDYTGADPEPAFQDRGAVDNGGDLANPDVLAPGIDRRYNYFQNRTITLGLNLKF